MLRNYDLQDAKRRQQELIEYAEQRRWAARVNRPERSETPSRTALRLRPLFAR